MEITDYSVRKLSIPCDPAISDSQYTFDTSGLLCVELETNTDETGIGIGGISADTPLTFLQEQFESVGEEVIGSSPFQLRNRRNRFRGGHHGNDQFEGPVDIALWDLCGKHLDLPLYKLLGGQDPAVPTYGSGLAFAHSDRQTRSLYEAFEAQGVDAAKVKVGYPTVDEDIERLDLVRDVLGDDCTLMVDANEAWGPKEAIRRAHAYRDAGFDLYLIEDPVLREDVEALKRVSDHVPFTHINTGEYVNLEAKRRLLENRATDMLNLRHGIFSTALDGAVLANVYGVPIHVGDTPCEIGIHFAAAMPEVTYIEYWKRPWEEITEQSVRIEDGNMIAPDDPGHGVTISESAFEKYGEGDQFR